MLKYTGKFFNVVERNNWEFVERHGLTGVVAIIAVTGDSDCGNIVLLEQYREPLQKRAIEVPAGLVGDDGQTESPIVAAKRELFEETGYEAGQFQEIGTFCVSPGLTNECLTYVLATDLKKTGEGGGDSSEDIRVFELPIPQAAAKLLAMAQQGDVIVDAKVFTSLIFAYSVSASRLRANLEATKESII